MPLSCTFKIHCVINNGFNTKQELVWVLHLPSGQRQPLTTFYAGQSQEMRVRQKPCRDSTACMHAVMTRVPTVTFCNLCCLLLVTVYKRAHEALLLLLEIKDSIPFHSKVIFCNPAWAAAPPGATHPSTTTVGLMLDTGLFPGATCRGIIRISEQLL
jgi:hypothetical protein